MLYVLRMILRGYNLLTVATSVRKNDIVAHVAGAAGADVRGRRLAPAPERLLGALGS